MQESAFAMSADICGPFKQGTNLRVSKRTKVRHAVPKWPAPGEQQEVDSEATGDGDEKEKNLLPESEHGPPIASLGDLLEAPKPKELVSEKVAGFLKGKSSLGRGS